VNRFACSLLLASLLWAASAIAHDLPLSYIDLHVNEAGIDVTIETSAKNFARELATIDEEALLLQPDAQRDSVFALGASRMELSADGAALHPEFRGIEVLSARKDVRLRLFYRFQGSPEQVSLRSELFSADPRHKTFVNVYRDEALKYQDILNNSTVTRAYVLAGRQTTPSVIRRFVQEGVHHIFIGPDHILFLVGLLLLGGTIKQLLKIITAFTIAHSVTLVLATLNLVNPPARVIEAAIALSIIFVGAHALLYRGQTRDWRLLFAFGFGFIHGFGFANVLREMQLPPQALGWSLFSFNLGVELGQACIVLAIAPALAFLARRSASLSRQVVLAGSFGVIAAGAFWLTERLQ